MNKVLIVDDEEDIHDILAVYMKRMGIDVSSALTGEDGVKLYKKMFENGKEPMVVMDLNLSGSKSMDGVNLHMEGNDKKMDGVRATRAIFKINPDAKIWGYTAWNDTVWAEKLKDTGVKKIVKRLVPFKEFAEMVKDFLEG